MRYPPTALPLNWEYEATAPGTYQFSCHYVSADGGPEMTIAMIDDYRNRAIDKNYLKMTCLPIGLIISGGLFLWTYLKRNTELVKNCRVAHQWRICFEWDDGAPGPSNVEIVDYH
jgi:hypothetical protein